MWQKLISPKFPQFMKILEEPGFCQINALYFSEFCANFVLGILLGIKLGITGQSAFLLGITWQLASVPGNCVQNVLGTKHN